MIEHDEFMGRDYIALPGGWEFQTRGNGSTVRLANTVTGERYPLALPEPVLAALEQMARDAHAEVERLRCWLEYARNYTQSLVDHGESVHAAGLVLDLDAAMVGKTATPMTRAARDVLAERARQVGAEGWTPEHDDLHEEGQLAGAAAGYARHVNARGWVFAGSPDDYKSEPPPIHWPWDDEWWKPSSPRRDLIKAGALILAEIERIDRATEKEAQS